MTHRDFIRFVTEILNLTGDLMNYSHVNYSFMEKIFKIVITLINVSKAQEDEILETHWSFLLRERTKREDFWTYEKLLKVALKILFIGCHLRENKQLETAMELFV